MFITQRPQLMRKMERWTGLFSRFLIMVMNKMLMQCCSCTMITNQFSNDVVDKSLNRIQHTEDVNDRTALKQLINDRLSKSPNINDKLSITTDVVDKLVDIVCYIRRYNHAKAGSISNYIGKSVSRTREYLQALIAIKMVLPEGGNKNRTYSVVVDNNVKL